MGSTFRLIRLAATAEMRNAGLRLLGITGLVSCLLYALTSGTPAPALVTQLAVWLGRAYGIAACLWFAYAAVRDLNEKMGAAVRSKPFDGARWVLLTFGSGMLVWWVELALGFLGAAIGAFPSSGPSVVVGCALAFGRAAIVLLVAAGLSFSLSRMFRSPVGGIMVLLGWFAAMIGTENLPPFLRIDYSQNQPLFAWGVLFVLGITAFLVERIRRGEFRRPLVPLALILILGAAAYGGARTAVSRTPDALLNQSVVWDSVRLQDLRQNEQAPGFWLPDGRGGQVRTSAHAGKILFLYLFSPEDPEAVRSLAALKQLQKEFGPRGVQAIGICISTDHGDAALLASVADTGFPIGYDPTTRVATPEADSAIANAFRIETLPLMVVTDRFRRVKRIATDASFDVLQLGQLARERLEAEPE